MRNKDNKQEQTRLLGKMDHAPKITKSQLLYSKRNKTKDGTFNINIDKKIEYVIDENKGYTSRVLLINPPTDRTQFVGTDCYFPLGLISVATILRKQGDAAEVLDINNDLFYKDLDDDIFLDYLDDNIVPYIKEYRPDIIGIGGTFSGAFKYTRVISKVVKDNFPEIPTIVGGNHASTFKGLILRKIRSIDYVMIGEAEYTFPRLLKCLKENNGVGIEKIDGVCYRKGLHMGSYNPAEGESITDTDDIIVQNKGRYIDNLDALPHADFDIVGVDNYWQDTSGWYNPHEINIGRMPFPIISSRSCPLRCTFCNMWHVHGPDIRYRSANDVVDEIEGLYHKYGARYFQFMDDNFTFDKIRVIKMMEEIKRRNLKISFDTPNGVAINRLDADVISAMIEGGLVRISIAIESGSQEIRDIMKKGLKQQRIYDVVFELAKYDHLFIKAFFIIGMPEDTMESLEATRSLIREIPINRFNLNYATPFPGTALFNQLKAMKKLKYDVEDYVLIDGHQLRSDRPHYAPFKLTEEQLMEFMVWGEQYAAKLSDSSVTTETDIKRREAIKVRRKENDLYTAFPEKVAPKMGFVGAERPVEPQNAVLE